MAYTNSSLVSYTKLSPNHSGQRTHGIDRITPHCVVGQCSVETLGNIFLPTSRQASSNYGIGVDGRVGMYTDEGISGTNTKHRAGFNEMIEDALAGKIDLIVTKSVSRFARNTVDSLVTIRKLKEKGVQVYFEKENIYTFDGKGELLLTIMSSLAQEESRSISENVTWGQRKRFADGKVNLPYKQFLGYRKGADGFPEVVPEEAVIVRRIYGYAAGHDHSGHPLL